MYSQVAERRGPGDVEIGFCQASPRSRRALGSRPRRLPGSLRDRQFIRVSSKVVDKRTWPRGATPERQQLSSALSTLRHHGGGPGASPRRKRAALSQNRHSAAADNGPRVRRRGPSPAAAQRLSEAPQPSRTLAHKNAPPPHVATHRRTASAGTHTNAAPQRAAARSHTPLAPTQTRKPQRRATPRTARRRKPPRPGRRARKQ